MFNPKFTPLEKQGHIYKMGSILNKSENTSTNSRLNSRRVLNFDSALSDIQNDMGNSTPPVSRSANLGKKLLNLKRMTQSPYQMKNLALATPLTAAMEMYNWLYDKVRKKNYFVKGKFNNKAIHSNVELASFFRKLGMSRKDEILNQIILKLTEKVVKEEFKNVFIWSL